MLYYLESNNELDALQSGYRTGMSTQTALLNVVEDAKWAIDKRMVMILILFDFSKAFDTVDHTMLIVKLAQLGFSKDTLR